MATKKTAKKAAKHVIVRTYSAGVHFGVLTSRKGREVELANARRVWRWYGANTLNEVATKGVAANSRVSEPVASILLLEAIEVIPCTAAAAKSIAEMGWSK